MWHGLRVPCWWRHPPHTGGRAHSTGAYRRAVSETKLAHMQKAQRGPARSVRHALPGQTSAGTMERGRLKRCIGAVDVGDGSRPRGASLKALARRGNSCHPGFIGPVRSTPSVHTAGRFKSGVLALIRAGGTPGGGLRRGGCASTPSGHWSGRRGCVGSTGR